MPDFLFIFAYRLKAVPRIIFHHAVKVSRTRIRTRIRMEKEVEVGDNEVVKRMQKKI